MYNITYKEKFITLPNYGALLPIISFFYFYLSLFYLGTLPMSGGKCASCPSMQFLCTHMFFFFEVPVMAFLALDAIGVLG